MKGSRMTLWRGQQRGVSDERSPELEVDTNRLGQDTGHIWYNHHNTEVSVGRVEMEVGSDFICFANIIY